MRARRVRYRYLAVALQHLSPRGRVTEATATNTLPAAFKAEQARNKAMQKQASVPQQARAHLVDHKSTMDGRVSDVQLSLVNVAPRLVARECEHAPGYALGCCQP